MTGEKQPRGQIEVVTQVQEAVGKNTEVLRSERQAEVVSDLRDRYGILFVMAQPRELIRNLGLTTEDTDWFKEALGLPKDTDRLRTVHAIEDTLPETVEESGIIIGGSAHSAYEDAPWIHRLEDFIRAMAAQKKPILGVCFGHQLVVQYLGGKVEKNSLGREVGVNNIDLTTAGSNDLLFKGITPQFQSVESHEDVVTQLPQLEKVAVLAHNPKSPHQALSLGEWVRTVQFHPEITSDVLAKRVQARADILIKEGTIKDAEALAEFLDSLRRTDPSEVGKRILQNFDREFIVKYSLGK